MAARLAVRPTTLSNWELGARRVRIDLQEVDRALDGNGALCGLMWALSTRRGLESETTWSGVYRGPSAPVWAWIRSDAPQIEIEVEWGVFRVDTTFDNGTNGAFFTVGGSSRHSPVVIRTSEPSWCDFGIGPLPSSIPDASVFDALDLVKPSTATGPFMELFSSDLAERFDQRRHREISGIARRAPGLVEPLFKRLRRRRSTETIAGPWKPLPEKTDQMERLRFGRLRQARDLSLAETAERISANTSISVSKDTLRRFENDTGAPHHSLLPAALDHVLGATGSLAVMEISSGVGEGSVNLPPYWHAPIWLAFDGPSDQLPIELSWGPWRREIAGPLPLLAISHHSQPSQTIRIVAGKQTRWTVGLGRRRDAVPIDQGWVPADIDAATKARSEVDDALLDAIRYSARNNEPEAEPVVTEDGATS